MLKALFGFGKQKQEDFNVRVSRILAFEFKIDTNVQSNPNFSGLGHLDLMSRYFYQNRTPEHCALQIALSYLENILRDKPFAQNDEAVELEARIVNALNVYTNQGTLFPELKPLALQVIEKLHIDFA